MLRGEHGSIQYLGGACPNPVKLGKESIHLYEGNPMNLHYPLFFPVFLVDHHNIEDEQLPGYIYI